MDLNDEITIAAPRETVYAALNDADVLRVCIPGCEELEKRSDTELAARVKLKIGPVKATFKGDVTLDPSDAPAAFSLKGEGNGGVAGFAKGGADVELEETGPAETVLRYTAKAEIGGKLAQLGSRLVQSTAKKLSGQFFEAFKARVEGG
ncbi:MAG: carbon monoxide dehydrogenase subunit G [Paracoccaceae bacterium]|nr:carbon monoxide dehydrogenase subunit G [Paracoccaceae bacterium]